MKDLRECTDPIVTQETKLVFSSNVIYSGRLSYFFDFDGVKYGEHILNDLGCAFEHISPFGFNANGWSGGGAGQGAPSGWRGRYQ